VLTSPIARTLVEQTPTKVLFPNPDASAEEYLGGLGLTRREFQLVRDRMHPGSRQFLVKQGRHSVICELDLKGFDAEIAVISGRAANIVHMESALSACGSEPDQWLPEYLRALGAPSDRFVSQGE
jgi:type IV secretion system protein VirB4